jgi:hypothetical protein
MKKLLIVALLLCSAAPLPAQQSKGKFDYLKSWANTDPLDFTVKPRRNFYALPEIHSRIIRLVGEQGYKRIIDHSELVTPIDLIGGYLVARGFTKTKEPDETIIVAVRLWDGTLHVGLIPRDGSPAEWHSSKGSFHDLPTCARE